MYGDIHRAGGVCHQDATPGTLVPNICRSTVTCPCMGIYAQCPVVSNYPLNSTYITIAATALEECWADVCTGSRLQAQVESTYIGCRSAASHQHGAGSRPPSEDVGPRGLDPLCSKTLPR